MEKFNLNGRILEFEPRRIMDVAELKRRMAGGALLYWSMLKRHAVLYDPSTDKVAQLALFKQLWGLERGNQIRHDRYDGHYQVFVPTSPALVRHRAAQKSDELFADSSNSFPAVTVADADGVSYEPYI